MKNNLLRIIFIFFISFVLCNEKEKYSLIPYSDEGYRNKATYRIQQETYFDLPGIGRIQLINKFIHIEEWLGEENGFELVKMTRKEIETDYLSGNIEEVPYEYLAMEDAPCLVYINKDGWTNHIEPVNPDDEYLQDIFEAAYLDNTNFTNIYYPFGDDAKNLSIDDQWYSEVDSIRRFLNSESPESIMSAKSTHTLKKVKVKKGKKIASINTKTDITMNLNIILLIRGERIFLTGDVQGTSVETNKIYLEPLELISSKGYVTLNGEMEMDGDKFRTTVYTKSFRNRIE